MFLSAIALAGLALRAAPASPFQVLLGHWHAKGVTIRTPFSAASRWTGTWSCREEGANFVVCVQRINGTAVTDLAVYSNDRRNKRLRYTEIDENGTSSSSLTRRNGVWYYEDAAQRINPKTVVFFRTLNTFMGNKESFSVQYSYNHHTWLTMGHGSALRTR